MLTIGKYKGKVFVISLLHCDDRRKFILMNLQKHNSNLNLWMLSMVKMSR